jgi:hypothetical protein
MTIVVGVACPDGVVIAGDSRTSYQSVSGGHRVGTDFAHKVFAIFGQFVAATYGWAFLNGKTISGLMVEFQATVSPPADVEAAATALRDFFRAQMDDHVAAGPDPAPADDVLGFLIGGYDAAWRRPCARVSPPLRHGERRRGHDESWSRMAGTAGRAVPPPLWRGPHTGRSERLAGSPEGRARRAALPNPVADLRPAGCG